MTFTPGVGPDGTAPPNSSGIHVIVVGLGVAGLTAAIECYRKGHRVTLFERSPVVKGVGKSEAIQVLAKACNSSILKQRVTASPLGRTAHASLLNGVTGLYMSECYLSGSLSRRSRSSSIQAMTWVSLSSVGITEVTDIPSIEARWLRSCMSMRANLGLTSV